MSKARYKLQPIGWVESPLVDRDLAPRQGDEGAPDAWLVFDHRLPSSVAIRHISDEQNFVDVTQRV